MRDSTVYTMDEFQGVTPPIRYSFYLPFEKSFSKQRAADWMKSNWHTCFYYSAAYVILIFSIRHIMANRKPFSLNKLLIAWNISLAIFSIVCFSRTAPEFFTTLLRDGIFESVCSMSFVKRDRVSSMWSFLFVLSKLPELGDTIFIVLRKQPLIFLHWYHHVLTLIYCWFAYKDGTSSARWFIVMNSFIHSIMYTYYALKALKFRIPKKVAALLTFLQLMQMVVGCYVNYKVYEYLLSGKPCHVSKLNIFVSAVMYFSYFILFSRFFYLSYIRRFKKRKLT